ncbi:MAG: endonuclease NucS [Nanoarchaeota archaeon]|nr:endonuclease NucS [Nanoarchaeota archaeon]MCG2718231.1 endonuclease NucS [Nanoarchaeota archaeon]
MHETQERIKRALKGQSTIVIGANCTIEYNGRAESYLPEGDRVIIIKPDRNLIVHQPIGTAPVNYMKTGTEHNIYYEDKKLYLKSKHVAQKEEMIIRLHNIHFLQTKILQDGEKITLKGSEKDMSDKIYNNPKLIEDDFKPLSREEHTKYGFIDVFGYDKNNTLVIIECKRYTATLDAVTQLRRYVEKIKKNKGLEKVRGIIAAPDISANARKMLEDWGFEYKKADPPKYHGNFNKKQKKLGEF